MQSEKCNQKHAIMQSKTCNQNNAIKTHDFASEIPYVESENGLFNEKNSDFESSNFDFASKKLNQKFMIFNSQISNLDPFFLDCRSKNTQYI